jgi:hypothetical protein
MECERCGKSHDGSYGTGRFCSKQCCFSREHSVENRKKISESLKKVARERGLGNRRYCLQCKRPLSWSTLKDLCRWCGAKNLSPTKQTYQFRKKRKEFLVSYKGGKCEICGYDRCLRALDFHHTDPSQKDFNVTSSKNVALEKAIKEVDKCTLVCCRCHREIEEGLIKVH